MRFTDYFIQRPVLATVISLLIMVLGIRSVVELPIREYPFTQNAVVTVATSYVGADPDLISGFITTPLENSIAQANGIDYLTSMSTQNMSTIQATLRLNYDPNKALTEINTKVNAVLNQLPKNSQQPVITVAIGETIDSMYMGFYSKELESNQITDYLIRVVQPKLQSVEGVQQAEILGERRFAMRAWLDPAKMAAYALTTTDVANALASNDFISAVGRTEGNMVVVNLTAETGLHTVDEFRKLVIKAYNGAFIRLEDVALVTLGSDNYDSAVSFDGEDAVYIGIKVAPSANFLTVIENVREVFPAIQEQLPHGLNGRIVYDATKYVSNSIHEVERALLEALTIVTVVIFLFLGTFRSVFIPVVAIPLSLIGAFFIMLLLGFSINLLTLLALVLAIGLVVDDAIIVVENVHRHIEAGMSAFKAALQGARELAGPIIAISVVLIAVYVPVGFMGGLTGALFTEFAFTLAGAVAVSAIVALTLSPMMCAQFMKSAENHTKGRFVTFIDHRFEKLKQLYSHTLQKSLDYSMVTVVFALIILLSIYFLYVSSKTELAPQEDQGIIISLLTAPPNASLRQTQLYARQVFKVFKEYSETDHIFQIEGESGLNTSIAGMVLKPWEERRRTTNSLQPELQERLSEIAGARLVVFQPSPLPGGGGGLPVQFVIGTTESYNNLNVVSEELMRKALANGLFMFLDTDLKLDKPQISIEFERDKVAELGLTMQDVGNMLAFGLGGNYINYFSLAGRSYQVIPQMSRQERLNAEQLLNYHISTGDGSAIALSTIAHLTKKVVPESLNHFQQLNSATISGVPMPGITLGEALQTLKQLALEILPQGYNIDYAGQSRQYQQESRALVITFFFALIIIFLALSAQFESFRDPIIVLVSVPMSICGAMIFINLGVGGQALTFIRK